MKTFENKYQFQEWLGELLHKELGDNVEEVSEEANESTGRCDVFITFKNGDEIKLAIS